MKKKLVIDLIFNIVITLCVFIGITLHVFLSIGDGPLDGGGVYTFRYFTNLSNIFCGMIALWTTIIEIKMLITKKDNYPSYLNAIREISIVSVMVTFVTINFIFLPILLSQGSEITLYHGQSVMTHITTPLLAVCSFIFFAPGKAFNYKESFLSIIPEFIYAVIYEIEVPILSNWPDFYGFTLGGRWYAPFIVAPTICLMAYLCSLLLSICHNKWINRSAKK